MRRPLLCALLLAPALASAQYDPRYRWRTLTTPHFQLTFHGGEYRLAVEAARDLERAHLELAPLFEHVPETRTQVVLSDDSDDANGSATALPYDTVRLYAVPPWSLEVVNQYRDWVWGLVSHEYTHILNLDTIRGWPRAFNAVFGKLAAPNMAAPTWLVEGYAVEHEDGGAGRNVSALYDGYLRAAVLSGREPSLSRASNDPLEWPRGDIPYLYGGRFLAFLEDRYGHAAVTGMSLDLGAAVFPWALDPWVRPDLGGKSVEAAWLDFLAAERVRFERQLAQIRERPVTPFTRLTHRGGRVFHPRWTAGGKALVFYGQSPDDRGGLFEVGADGKGERRLADVDGNGSLALLPGGVPLVAETDLFREYELWDDLYEVRGGKLARVTFGERATDPDLSADGATAVYVARCAPAELCLRRRRLDSDPSQPGETLFAAPGAQVFLPRLSPDGRRIAFELQQGGRRDIAVLEEGRVTRVTDTGALDANPAWSPDGRTLYFTSDRSGVYDVYALDLDGGKLSQVTNVETGAFQPAPSPDGRSLAFVTLGPDGFDLAVTPLDRATWLAPAPVVEKPAELAADVPRDPDPAYPVHDYSPWPTVRPTWWLPVVSQDAAGLAVGAFTSGQDVLGRHAWSLEALASPYARDLDYAASYVGGFMFPQLALSSTRFVSSQPGGGGLEVDSIPLGAQLSFTRSHLDRAQRIDLGWRLATWRNVGASRFADATASELSLGVGYSDALRFTDSISREQGRDLGLRVRFASKELGGDAGYASARASASQFLRVPPSEHVVLALRAAGGASVGDLGGRHVFRLGGLALADPLNASGADPDVLRGYVPGALEGADFVLGTAELRFPLAAPEWGHGAWPLFLRRLHGALFADAGDAFTPGEGLHGAGAYDFRDLRFGAGAELGIELVLGWQLRADLRLGVARGFGRLMRGQLGDPLATTQAYLEVGQAF